MMTGKCGECGEFVAKGRPRYRVLADTRSAHASVTKINSNFLETALQCISSVIIRASEGWGGGQRWLAQR